MAAIAIILGLSAGNFFYQAVMVSPDYALALERSFFQASAIIAFIVIRALSAEAR